MSTAKQWLRYHDEPIAALYSSTCGGHSEPNQLVFGGEALEYLKGVEDEPFCSEAENFTWESHFSREELSLLKAHGIDFKNLKIGEKAPWGRIYSFYVTKPHFRQWKASELLRVVGELLDWGHLKSAWFSWKWEGDTLAIRGRGFGHGVGLCEHGALGMAKQGWNYKKILSFYFPGAVLN